MDNIRTVGLVAAFAVVMSGCTIKPPPPEAVKNWDKDTTINYKLLECKKTQVPKDPLLKEAKWAYKIKTVKRGGDFFQNDRIVKVFLVAHNADEIVIVGKNSIAQQYKNYFRENGVTADIEIESDSTTSYVVWIFFFNKRNQDEKIDYKCIINKPPVCR